MTITRATIRYYSDNRQAVAYVEWSDGSRTDGVVDNAPRCRCCGHARAFNWRIGRRRFRLGEHLLALFTRATREGAPVTFERW